jgi:hypothetical protein
MNANPSSSGVQPSMLGLKPTLFVGELCYRAAMIKAANANV